MQGFSRGLAAVVVWSIAATVMAADSGNVVLTLDGGLARGEDRYKLDIEVPVRDGKWSNTCWGTAFWFNRGFHEGKIRSHQISGDMHTLEVAMDIGDDPWSKGGKATYTIEVKPSGDSYEGTFNGKFIPATTKEALEVSGKAQGRMTPVWPTPVADFTPLAANEHPRLAFRKSDVAKFRKLAKQTPEGEAILAQTLAILGKRGKQQGDKFSNWPAVGYAFAYQMTGEKKYADEAMEIIDQTMFKNSGGRRGSGRRRPCREDIGRLA